MQTATVPLVPLSEVVCDSKNHIKKIFEYAVANTDLYEDQKTEALQHLNDRENIICQLSAVSFAHLVSHYSEKKIKPRYETYSYCTHGISIVKEYPAFEGMAKSVLISTEQQDIITHNFLVIQDALISTITQIIHLYFGLVEQPVSPQTQTIIICNPKNLMIALVNDALRARTRRKNMSNKHIQNLHTNQSELFKKFDSIIAKYSEQPCEPTTMQNIATPSAQELALTILNICYDNAALSDKEEEKLIENQIPFLQDIIKTITTTAGYDPHIK